MNLFKLLFPKKAEEIRRLKDEREKARANFIHISLLKDSIESRLLTCQKTYADYVKETDKKISNLEGVITKYRKQFGPYKIKGKRAA